MSAPRSSEQNSRNNDDKSAESQSVQPPHQTPDSQHSQGSQEPLPRYLSYQYHYASDPYQAYQGQPIPRRASSYSGQSSERQYIQQTAYVHSYPPPPYMDQQQSTQAHPSYPQNTGQPGQQFTGQPDQQNISHSGQQYGPPSYYVSTTPNVPYMLQYPPPIDIKSSPRVRPGGRFRQGTEELEGWTGFQDKKVRAVFIRKVYTILMLQLLFTMGIIALFIFEPHVKRFVQENKFVYFIALAIFAAVYLGMACCQDVRRKFPTNIIALIVFTMAMSYMMGTISSFHNTEAVLIAVGICAAVCLFVTLLSFYSKNCFHTSLRSLVI